MPIRKNTLRAFLFGLFLAGIFFPLPARAALSRQVVHYEITAKLDTFPKAVIGQETVTWINDSPDHVSSLRFHLYLNAFKNEKSTFFKELGGRRRRGKLRGDKWGYIDIQKMTLADGTDLLPTLRYEHPDDNNLDDQTVCSVKLPKPVPPGGQVTLRIEFFSKLPEVFARTGYKRNFYMVGQWFPKLGVYEKAGMRGRKTGGWNCHQFHANSEFYADYGSYRVTLTVPDGFKVGATGARTSESADPKAHTQTVTYLQEDVHDFAWTASPAFVVQPDTHVFPSGHRVAITLLNQPDYAGQKQRLLEAAHQALKYFGRWYGEYPYATLTIVMPPTGAFGAGGMEYPTLFTGITLVPADWPLLRNIHYLVEETIVHEFGHQYWYGLVGSNEFEESWLDEGLNTYSTGKVLAAWFGDKASFGRCLGAAISELEFARWQVVQYPHYDPVNTFSWRFFNGNSYGTNSYAKVQILLTTLENYLGPDRMENVMRTYFERFRFKHPATEDFVRTANEVSGQNLDWFFNQFVYGTQKVDYAVAGIASQEIKPQRGFFDLDGRKVFVESGGDTTVLGDTALTKGKTLAKAKDRNGKKKEVKVYESAVQIQRKGDGIFPVEIEIKFEKEKPFTYHWDGEERWIKYRFRGPHELEYAAVDPQNKIVLDLNRLNNSRTIVKQSRAITRWSSRWLFVMQNLLQTLAVF